MELSLIGAAGEKIPGMQVIPLPQLRADHPAPAIDRLPLGQAKPVDQPVGTRGEPLPPPAPPGVWREAERRNRLIDSHGRTIRDVRLSITDRCNFRCVYCLEPEARFLPRRDLLSLEELVELAGVLVDFGATKLRLTGGEPTLRSDLLPLMERLAGLKARAPELDLALTTNGAMLDCATARRWRDAGLDRVTISIDAVEDEVFARLTRSGCTPQRVLEGVEAAIAAGLRPVKLNAVIVRGRNDDQIAALAGLARRFGIEMRYIEFMPLDAGVRWDREAVVSGEEIVAAIHARFPLERIGRDDPAATAERYRFFDGQPGSIGIIAPVTKPFCGACSRLRITAEGKVRPCLFSRREWDLRPLLRGAGGPARREALRRALVDATWTKQPGHGIATERFERPERSMSAIGG